MVSTPSHFYPMAHNLYWVHLTTRFDCGTQHRAPLLANHYDILIGLHPFHFLGMVKYIASCSHGETIRVWDTTLGIATRKPFGGHNGSVNSVAFSPDDILVTSASHDMTIGLWKAVTGELVKELIGHSDPVKSVVFSPDGTQILSGSSDKTIRLWNVSTGKTVGELLRGHRASVTSVAVSPDGTLIVSGSFDWTVQMWDVKTSSMIGTPLDTEVTVPIIKSWKSHVPYPSHGTPVIKSNQFGAAMILSRAMICRTRCP